MIQLAERQWDGFWGDYWSRRGVVDLKTLRAISAKDFWLRYHSGLEPSQTSHGSSSVGSISVDVHAITEARGLAYVIYRVTHATRKLPSSDDFLVLRARFSDGEWRLVAFPRITAMLREQLDRASTKKRAKE